MTNAPWPESNVLERRDFAFFAFGRNIAMSLETLANGRTQVGLAIMIDAEREVISSTDIALEIVPVDDRTYGGELVTHGYRLPTVRFGPSTSAFAGYRFPMLGPIDAIRRAIVHLRGEMAELRLDDTAHWLNRRDIR